MFPDSDRKSPILKFEETTEEWDPQLALVPRRGWGVVVLPWEERAMQTVGYITLEGPRSPRARGSGARVQCLVTIVAAAWASQSAGSSIT